MGFFRKKRGNVLQANKKDLSKSASTYPVESLTITSLVTPTSFDDATAITKKRQNSSNKRWITPRSVKTPLTMESSRFGSSRGSNSLLGGLNVVATDDIEITTLESQQALVQQREAIRRQLFDPPTSSEDAAAVKSTKNRNTRSVLYRTATNASQEILPNGNIIPDSASAASFTPGKLSADRASLPLSAVSQSFESSYTKDDDDDNSHRIIPIELATRSYNDSIEQQKSPAMTSMERSSTDPFAVQSTTSSSLRNFPFKKKQQPKQEEMMTEEPVAISPTPTSPNTSHGSRPMDERQVDQALEFQRNQGKSPLKGMPDDERLEYQRDEIDTPMDEPSHEDATDEGESTVDYPIEEDEEYSAPPPKRMGLAAGGALVAAAVGWGANAVDQACIGDGDLEDEETVRAAPSLTNHRPRYLSEAECKKFQRRITRNGFVLLNLIVDGESWTGRTVTMCIAKGSQEHPAQLEWTTVTGGQNHEILVSSVDLMDILTIDTDGIPEDMEDDVAGEDSCVFTITTDDGNVFLFEANSIEERDRIVNGLKTIIARWARQMVAGEVSATSELYAVYQTPRLAVQSELSVSPNPTFTMNRMAHRLLDL